MLLKFSEIESQLGNLEIPTLSTLYSYEVKYSFLDKCYLFTVKEFASIVSHEEVFKETNFYNIYSLIEDVIMNLVNSKEDIPLPEWVVDDNTKNHLFHLIGLTGSNSSSLRSGTKQKLILEQNKMWADYQK